MSKIVAAMIALCSTLSLPALAAESQAKLAALVRRQCFEYARTSLAEDYRKHRGGSCTTLEVTVDPTTANRGFVAPLSAIREIPVIEAYGTITISCSGALFFSDETFTHRIRFLAGPFNHGDCSVQDKN